MAIVKAELDGKIFEAEYVVDGGVVTVYGERGLESTQLGGMNEEQVARLLLRALEKKGHIDPVE